MPLSNQGLYVPSWIVNWLREKFGKYMQGPEKMTKYIYISRAKARSRRLMNEDRLLAYLQSVGFDCYFLEEMTVKQQIELFSSARIIVAPHGSGLTNLAFSHKGAKLIEIHGPSWVNSCFAALAQIVGIDYSYVMGEPYRLGDYDIVVNVDQVKAELERFLVEENEFKS